MTTILDSNQKQSNSIGLIRLYQMVSDDIKESETKYSGLVVADLSIDTKIEPNRKFNQTYLRANSKIGKNNFVAQLIIPNYLVEKLLQENPDAINGGTFDITIGKLEIGRFGTLNITVFDLKESGVSQKELRARRLERFCKERNYKSLRRNLPRIVSSIKAITSKASSIESDLISQIGLKTGVEVVRCNDSREIASEIHKGRDFDIIVLFRGGREDEAMSIFSDEVVIEAIMNSKRAVYTALGHEVDTPFVCKLSDGDYPTPTSFAKSIKLHNRKEIDSIVEIINFISNHFNSSIKRKHELINEYIDSFLGLKNRAILQGVKGLESTVSVNKRVADGVISESIRYLKNEHKTTTLLRQSKESIFEKLSSIGRSSKMHLKQEILSQIDKIHGELGDIEHSVFGAIRGDIDFVDGTAERIMLIANNAINTAKSREEDAMQIKQQKRLIFILLVLSAILILLFFVWLFR